MDNMFLKAANATVTFTENGALSNTSTGSEISDQFGIAANYRGRDTMDVFSDQRRLWEENPYYALRFPFYLRMITRKVKIADGVVTEKVQKGQGARDESFKRLLWIAVNHPDVFYKNLWILPLVGCWKDLWEIMYYDRIFAINVINENLVFDIINAGLQCNEHVDLIKKFMPRIKSKSKMKTDWNKISNQLAKDFANYNGISYSDYNHLKTSGSAHDFQKLICSGDYKSIDWNTIPGRALSLLSNGKFLSNHNLEKEYTKWIIEQPTAKFTGYVFELGKKVIEDARQNKWNPSKRAPLYQRITWDKQFDELIRKASENGSGINGNVWCALDTSGSMQSRVNDTVTAEDICLSLGVFFSTLNKGAFHKNVIMFDETSRVKQLDGGFTEMINQIINERTAWGSTNFQSVVDEIVRIRIYNPNIPLEDYPQTLLVVSDMQFNPTNSYSWGGNQAEIDTNYQLAKRKLASVFPQEFVDNFKFVWWQVTERAKDYPATLDDGGCYFMSGFDGSIISMILGEEVKDRKEPLKMEEVISNALSQEILNYIEM